MERRAVQDRKPNTSLEKTCSVGIFKSWPTKSSWHFLNFLKLAFSEDTYFEHKFTKILFLAIVSWVLTFFVNSKTQKKSLSQGRYPSFDWRDNCQETTPRSSEEISVTVALLSGEVRVSGMLLAWRFWYKLGDWLLYPIGSIYGIFTYMKPIKINPNVGKYTIHGSYGYIHNLLKNANS